MSEEENKEHPAEQKPEPTSVTTSTSEVSAGGEGPPQQSMLEALKVYRDTRMLKILLIGSMSGFPWILIASMMSLWLKAEGLSRSGIGFFGIVFTVYAFNMWWAPIIDTVKLPFLSKFGQRRSWIVLMQACIVVLTLVMSLFNPQEALYAISICAFLIALSSATMDVAIDAMRIELIGRDEASKVGAGSAMATSGWWIGFGGFGAVGLVVASFVETSMGVEKFWPVAFQLMALVPIISVALMMMFIAEPKHAPAEPFTSEAPTMRFANIWIKPVMSFIGNYGLRIGLMLIALIFLFKVGEAFLGRMSIIFYKEIGFSKNDIALYSKGFGTLALCAFAVIGSLINARYGLYRGLFIGGIAMASTNLLFAILAYYPAEWLFAVAVVTDQFTTAMSTVALVAFLSQLCDRAYAATQYAAFASIGNFSRTTLAVFSGLMVDSIDSFLGSAPAADGAAGDAAWAVFFVLTTLMVLPSLALLLYIRKDIEPLMAGQTTKVI